jgi:CHAD domain-containing protein
MKTIWRAEASAAENARQVLPEMARRFFRAGRKAAGPGTSFADLHRFRLKTKRFRYTLELFEPVYGPGLETRMKLLRQLQKFLGELNDCAQTQELLDGVPRGAARSLREFLSSRADEKAAAFREFWTGTFDRPGQEENWRRYLSRTPANAASGTARDDAKVKSSP